MAILNMATELAQALNECHPMASPSLSFYCRNAMLTQFYCCSAEMPAFTGSLVAGSWLVIPRWVMMPRKGGRAL